MLDGYRHHRQAVPGRAGAGQLADRQSGRARAARSGAGARQVGDWSAKTTGSGKACRPGRSHLRRQPLGRHRRPPPTSRGRSWRRGANSRHGEVRRPGDESAAVRAKVMAVGEQVRSGGRDWQTRTASAAMRSCPWVDRRIGTLIPVQHRRGGANRLLGRRGNTDLARLFTRATVRQALPVGPPPARRLRLLRTRHGQPRRRCRGATAGGGEQWHATTPVQPGAESAAIWCSPKSSAPTPARSCRRLRNWRDHDLRRAAAPGQPAGAVMAVALW